MKLWAGRFSKEADSRLNDFNASIPFDCRMEIKLISGSVAAPQGFTAAGVHCGVRKSRTKRDLALIFSQQPCAAAAVYTTNKVKGAPILVDQENLADGRAQAVICNSGNANTCNANGVEIARLRTKRERIGHRPHNITDRFHSRASRFRIRPL